jgi:hypothetical protein
MVLASRTGSTRNFMKNKADLVEMAINAIGVTVPPWLLLSAGGVIS